MISPNQSLNFRNLKDAKKQDLPKPIPRGENFVDKRNVIMIENKSCQGEESPGLIKNNVAFASESLKALVAKVFAAVVSEP